ncbi:MAG: DUF6090 family protein [Cyclobacteriaceae bacterium]
MKAFRYKRLKKINWKYAVGEILIVFVGITMAFSINTCAENRSNKALNRQYLVNLKSELEEDKSLLEKNIEKINVKITTIRELLPLLHNVSELNASHSQLVFAISHLEDFSPNNITYNTLISSGDFKLIDDFELRRLIKAHYTIAYRHISVDYERLENIHKKYLADYYIHHTDYSKFRNNEFIFTDTKLLNNILQSIEGANRLKIEASEKGIQSCSQLIESIDAKLK